MSDAPVLGPVNHVIDLDAAGDFEKKHTPYVAVEKMGDTARITVKVGHYLGHPNQPDHFIEWIMLYAGEAPIARFDLSAVAVDPEVSVVVRLDTGTVVKAIESCNLHGLWTATVTV
jgi:superoxide reductase